MSVCVYPGFRTALGQMSSLVAVDAGDVLIRVVPGSHPAEWLVLISVGDLGLGHTQSTVLDITGRIFTHMVATLVAHSNPFQFSSNSVP